MSYVFANATARQASRVEPDDATNRQIRLRAHEELVAVTQTLIAEYAGRLPAGTVIRQVARTREELLAAGIRAGLAPAVETAARSRLRALVPAHASPPA